MRVPVLLAAGVAVVAAAVAFTTCAPDEDAQQRPSEETARADAVEPVVATPERAPRRRDDPAAPVAPTAKPEQVAAYSGTVVAAEDETPIAGARVELVEIDARANSWPVAASDAVELASATTAADGTFELRGRVGDRVKVHATAAGREPVLDFARAGARHVLRLKASVRRELTVLAGEDRTPLAGAQILVSPHRNVTEVAATSGEDGRVAFYAPTNATVIATATGRATTQVPQESGTVLMWKAIGAIAGVVTADGRGVGGARVALKWPWFGGCSPVVVTGGDGRFAFDGFDGACEVALDVSAPGYFDRTVTADVGDVGVVVELSRHGLLRGVVLGPDGAPVAEAHVEATCDPPQKTGSATTGADGRFELDAPATGDIEVVARSGCIEQESYGLSIPALAGRVTVPARDRAAGREIVVRIAPPTLSFVRIDAIDPDGRRLRAEHVEAPKRLTEEVDEHGRLSAAFALPPGTRVVTRLHTHADEARGQPPFAVEFPTSADPNAPPVVIRVPAFPVLRLAITSADGVIPPAGTSGVAIAWEVSPTGLVDLGANMGGSVDEASWHIEPGKRYRVKVGIQGLGVVVRDFGADDLVDGRLALRLDPISRVRGRIVGTDGRPPGGLMVMAGHGGGQPDVSGVFDFAINDAGETRISVTSGGATVWSEVRRLVPGETIDLGTIVATPPKTVEVRGVVSDERGRPVSAARVWFRPPDQSLLAPSTQTGADGAFVLTLQPPVSGALLATKRDHGAAWAAVNDSTEKVAIRLPAAGKVRFPDVDDASTYGVRSPDGVTWWPSRRKVRDAFGAESFELPDLPPGRLFVFAETARGRIEREVEVVAGRTVDVAIE